MRKTISPFTRELHKQLRMADSYRLSPLELRARAGALDRPTGTHTSKEKAQAQAKPQWETIDWDFGPEDIMELEGVQK